jgi:hypothetical protein
LSKIVVSLGLLVGLCLISTGAIASPGSTVEFYVDKDNVQANDSNPGTEEEPFATIQKAVSLAKAGDTVYIKDGVYFEQVSLPNNGTPDSPIIIRAFPGHSPIIDGSDSLVATWEPYQGSIYKTTFAAAHQVVIEDDIPLNPVQTLSELTVAGSYYLAKSGEQPVLYVWTRESDNPSSHNIRVSIRSNGIVGKTWPLPGLSYVTLEGLTIRYSNDAGIEIVGAEHQGVIIRKCKMSWTGSDSIFVRNGSFDLIEDCLLEHALAYSGRTINIYNCKDTVFRKNTVREARCDLVNVTSSENILITGNIIHGNLYGSSHHPDLIQLQKAGNSIRCKGVVIENNLLYDGQTLGIMASYTDDTVIRNNVMYRVAGTGMDFAYSHKNLQVYNNTMPSNNLRVWAATNDVTNGVRVYNNIFRMALYDKKITDFVADHNIYVNTLAFALQFDMNWDPKTLEEFRQETGNEMHGQWIKLSADAVGYLDYDNDDFRLKADSPARNTGVDLSGFGMLDDFAGNPRGIEGSWEVGAFEYLVGELDVNQPPVIGELEAKSVLAGNKLEFTIPAEDPDDDRLYFAAAGMPEGALLDMDTGKFSWTPTLEQVGEFLLIFSAIDGSKCDRKNVSIVVYKSEYSPQNLHGEITPTGYAILSWDAPNNENVVAGYLIYRDGISIGSNVERDFTDRTIIPGKMANYTVFACDWKGNIIGSSEPKTVSAGSGCSMVTSRVNHSGNAWTGTIYVFASADDISWNATVSSGVEWLTLAQTQGSGVGDGKFEYSMTSNSGDSPRTGEITLSWDGGTKSAICQVIQKAKDTTSTLAFYDSKGYQFTFRNSQTGNIIGDCISWNGSNLPGVDWVPLVGDWNGDFNPNVGFYDSESDQFNLDNGDDLQATASYTQGFGGADIDYIPLIGDWDADGYDTVGLYTPETGVFFLTNDRDYNEKLRPDLIFNFGPENSIWIPIVGDWDGDGVDTVGLYDPENAVFYLKRSFVTAHDELVVAFGPNGEDWIPVAGDWDGDQMDTIGLYNPATGEFYIRNSNSPGEADMKITVDAEGEPVRHLPSVPEQASQ